MANTVRDAEQQAAARLAITAQSSTARRDAELLLAHITGLSRADLLTHPEQPLTSAQLEAYYQAVERRAQSEPIQYITGKQEFYGLELAVSRAVLIPRPETEHLVESGLRIAAGLSGKLRILDIGTGSGAIAIALATHLPQAAIVATDLSQDALDVAQANAIKHGVAERISFVHCDLYPPEAGEFDMVCSNPPYIANREILETQVAAFEPSTALYAGPTGTEVYERLIPKAGIVLRSAGSLLLEIGQGQSRSIEDLLQNSSFAGIHFVPDLRGIARVAIAHKPDPVLI
jgi:release factor glutamine methyltransferase